jgi:hypothetical protein
LVHRDDEQASTMRDGRPDWPRRNFIRIAIAGVSAGLCLPMSAVRASDKMTKAQAEYRDTPNGIYSCGNCTLFVAPSSCKVVDGEVGTDGWCKAYAMAD